MKNGYILQSLGAEEHFYSGITDDLDAWLSKHNSGDVTHTSKFCPSRIKSYVAFTDEARAITFEKYLKSGSGQLLPKHGSRPVSTFSSYEEVGIWRCADTVLPRPHTARIWAALQ